MVQYEKQKADALIAFNGCAKEGWKLAISGNQCCVTFGDQNSGSRNYRLDEFAVCFPSWVKNCEEHLRRNLERVAAFNSAASR